MSLVVPETPPLNDRAKELLQLIPRFKGGRRRNQIRTQRLEEIDRLVRWYRFDEGGYQIIEAEIRTALNRVRKPRKKRTPETLAKEMS